MPHARSLEGGCRKNVHPDCLDFNYVKGTIYFSENLHFLLQRGMYREHCVPHRGAHAVHNANDTCIFEQEVHPQVGSEY